MVLTFLNHLKEPLFPRTISTYTSEGRQFEVFSKEEMIKAFEQSDLLDCRESMPVLRIQNIKESTDRHLIFSS